MDKKFKLVIPIDKYQQIMAYTNLVNTEITQFADVEMEDDGTLVVGNVYLLKQEAGGAHVDMEEEDISKFMVELIKDGKTQMPRLWIHSHVNMQAFFSGTDVNTYTNTLDNGEWTVSLVVNKRQEMKAVLQQYKPFKYTWDLEIEVDYMMSDIPSEWKEEVKEKVKEKTYTQPKTKKKEEKYTYGEGNTLNWDKKPFIMWLGKNREDAIEKIDNMGLQRTWDEETQKFKFVNTLTDTEYLDYWDVVQDYNPNTTSN